MAAGKMVGARLSAETHERVLKGAARHGVSSSEYLRTLIDLGLEAHSGRKPLDAEAVIRKVLTPVLERLIFVESVSAKIAVGEEDFEAHARREAKETAEQEMASLFADSIPSLKAI